MDLQILGRNASVLTSGPMTCVSFVVQMVFHVLFEFVLHFEPFVTSFPVASERPFRAVRLNAVRLQVIFGAGLVLTSRPITRQSDAQVCDHCVCPYGRNALN